MYGFRFDCVAWNSRVTEWAKRQLSYVMQPLGGQTGKIFRRQKVQSLRRVFAIIKINRVTKLSELYPSPSYKVMLAHTRHGTVYSSTLSSHYRGCGSDDMPDNSGRTTLQCHPLLHTKRAHYTGPSNRDTMVYTVDNTCSGESTGRSSVDNATRDIGYWNIL